MSADSSVAAATVIAPLPLARALARRASRPRQRAGWGEREASEYSPHPARLATLRRATLPIQGRVSVLHAFVLVSEFPGAAKPKPLGAVIGL